jgi:hypothetical protein
MLTVTVCHEFNADNHSDLFWQHETSGDVYVWFMNGTTQTGGARIAHGVEPWKVAGPKARACCTTGWVEGGN